MRDNGADADNDYYDFRYDSHFFPSIFQKPYFYTHSVLMSLPVPICAFQAC